MATPPPESDLDDERIRALLASTLYLQEREASADRSQVYHPVKENLMSSSSQVPKSTEKPVALFSSKSKSSQEAFSENIFLQNINRCWETRKFDSDSLIRKILSDHFLNNNRDCMHAEAKSEVR